MIRVKDNCSSGIAAENTGRILSSYSQYTATATGVFANAITSKNTKGRVDHCYYPSNAGLSGAGTAVADLKAKDVPGKLNKLVLGLYVCFSTDVENISFAWEK